MDFTSIFGMLIVGALFASFTALIDSYRTRARIEGMEQAMADIMRGLQAHYELDGIEVPENVAKILRRLGSSSPAAMVSAAERYEFRCRI